MEAHMIERINDYYLLRDIPKEFKNKNMDQQNKVKLNDGLLSDDLFLILLMLILFDEDSDETQNPSPVNDTMTDFSSDTPDLTPF